MSNRLCLRLTIEAPCSLVILICGLLAAPAGAMATEYTVDSTGDQVDQTVGSAGCKTAVGTTKEVANENGEVQVHLQ